VASESPSGVHESAAPSGASQAAVFGILTLIWGTTWLGIKIGLESFPPFFSLALRFGLAGPAFLLIMKLRGMKIPWEPRHQPFFLTIGFLSFVVSYGVVYWCEQYITSGLAAVLFALLPLLTAMFARFMLHEEKLGAGKVTGLGLSLAGIAIIYSEDLRQIHPLAPVAALVMLISPAVTALSGVLSKQRSREISPLAMAGIPMTYGAIAHTILWLLLERGAPIAWTWPGVASVLYLTVLVSSHSGATTGLQHILSAARAHGVSHADRRASPRHLRRPRAHDRAHHDRGGDGARGSGGRGASAAPRRLSESAHQLRAHLRGAVETERHKRGAQREDREQGLPRAARHDEP
jgi:drug/metabolite transporter (DMT)-like permease